MLHSKTSAVLLRCSSRWNNVEKCSWIQRQRDILAQFRTTCVRISHHWKIWFINSVIWGQLDNFVYFQGEKSLFLAQSEIFEGRSRIPEMTVAPCSFYSLMSLLLDNIGRHFMEFRTQNSEYHMIFENSAPVVFILGHLPKIWIEKQLVGRGLTQPNVSMCPRATPLLHARSFFAPFQFCTSHVFAAVSKSNFFWKP